MKTAELTRRAHLRERSSIGTSVVVQEQEGGTVVFQNVAVIGLQSSNVDNGKPRTYSAEGLRAALSLYEGCRVYLNHLGWDESSGNRDLLRLVGTLRAARWDEATQKVRADLVALRTPDTQHALAIMQHMPEQLALSHDVEGMADDTNCVCAISTVHSVDLVPVGGTNRTLYEAATADITMGELLELANAGEVLVRAGGRTMRLAETETQQGAGAPTHMDEKEAKALRESVQALTARVEAAEADAAKAKAERDAAVQGAALERALSESGLPDASVAKLRPLLEGRDAEVVAKAINSEKEHLEALTKEAGDVRGLGDEGGAGDGAGAASALKESEELLAREFGLAAREGAK